MSWLNTSESDHGRGRALHIRKDFLREGFLKNCNVLEPEGHFATIADRLFQRSSINYSPLDVKENTVSYVARAGG